MKITRKALALLLSLAMMVTFMPMSVFAEDELNEEAQQPIAQESQEETSESVQETEQQMPVAAEAPQQGETPEVEENSVTFNVLEGGSFRLWDGVNYIYCFYDETEQKMVFVNNELGYVQEDGNPRFQFGDIDSIEVQLKPDNNYWLDRVHIGYDQYDLHPSKGGKSLKSLPGWEEKTYEENGELETWYTFDINFDNFSSDNVYIEGLFSTYDPAYYDDPPEYAQNRYQVVYDDLHGDDYYVEVNRNNAGWQKVESGNYYQYAKGDKLKFRICTPPLDEEAAGDKDNYPAVEISENAIDEETGDNILYYSDEEHDEIEISGNTFGYTPQSNDGVKVHVWWSVYGHKYDHAWEEEDMSPYYLVRTDVISGYGLVGFNDSFYGGGDLVCVDSKGKAKILTGKTTPVKIEPDGGNEVDYVLLNGKRIEGRDLSSTPGFKWYKCKSQNTNSYTYTASDETELYVAFRERTDWENAAEKLRTDRFAYACDDADQIKTLLAAEMFDKRLGNAFESVDEVKACLTVVKKNNDKGIAGKGQYSYTLSKDNVTATGTADVLERPTDIVVATGSESKVVNLTNADDSYSFYSVTLPYDKEKRERDVNVYGNSVKIEYEYEIEKDRIGFNLTNNDTIENKTLTIYNSNNEGNEFDRFECGSDEQQIRYNILKSGDNVTSTVTPVGANSIRENDRQRGSYKANVTKGAEGVIFKADLQNDDQIKAVYIGAENVTDSLENDEFTVSNEDMNKVVNIYIEAADHGPGHLALVHYRHYGSDNTNVFIGDNIDKPDEINRINDPNGDKTRETEYTTLVRLPGDAKDNNVRLVVGTGFPHIFTKIIVNDTDYSDNIPKSRAERIENFYEQQNNVSVEVPRNDDDHGVGIYNITTFTRAGRKDEGRDELFIGNFGWFSTASEDRSPSDVIDGGDIELVRAVYKEAGKADEVYYDENNESESQLSDHTAKSWISHDNGDGEAVFPTGTEVTVRLTPDYGKQLVSFGVNGKHFDKGDADERNEYTFIVQSGNFHLEAKFEDVKNTASIDDSIDNLLGASVESADNTNTPVESGTLNMKIEESDQMAEDPNAITAFDINMDNVFYAGKRKVNKDWTDEDMSTLDNKASIKLVIEEIDAGDKVRVIREHEGEEPTAVESSVDGNGNLIIESDKFSTYTICKDSEAKGKLGSATLATTSYTYNGGNKKPAVATVKNSHGRVLDSKYYTVSYPTAKNVGAYYVTINGKGRYAGTSVKAKFTIVPKGATIKTPKKAKKAFTAKWSKQSGKMSKKRITGYEVQYSTSSKFASGVKTKKVKGYKKTSVKIKKLKSKTTYYVRVRTYLGSYKSAWSKTKSVKTK